jgi:thioredoxin-like negative regulator of GroEL
MGVLAVGVGRVEAALPFFKAALDVKSNIALYWLSYFDDLIKLDRMVDAKAVLDQAKSKGAKSNGFDQIELQLNNSSVEVVNQTPNKRQKDTPTQPNILDELKLDKAIKLAKKESKRWSE